MPNLPIAGELASAVPLSEQLRSVPVDAKLRIDTPNALGCMDTRSIPVGVFCHDAAAECDHWASEAMKWRRKYAELRYPGMTREVFAAAAFKPCWVCGRPMDGLSEDDCHCFHRKELAVCGDEGVYCNDSKCDRCVPPLAHAPESLASVIESSLSSGVKGVAPGQSKENGNG